MDKNKFFNCVMCNKINNEVGLIPMSCYKIYGLNGHRICSECWWNNEYGFARENASHKCPGCLLKVSNTIP